MDVVGVGHFHEVTDLGTGRKRSTLLSYPKYRRGGSGWEPTRERIVSGGPADWQADESVHALTIGNDGHLLLDHPYEATPHRLGMRLAALGVLRADGTFDEEETPDSVVPTLVSENRLRWSDYFADIDLDVLYAADQVRTILTIKPDARTRLLGYRRTESRPAFVWRLDTGALNHDVRAHQGQPIQLGTQGGTETDGARFLSGGRPIMRMPRGGIRLATAETLKDRRRWSAPRRMLFRTRSQVAVMMEIVPWDILEAAPSGDLVLNCTVDYQQGQAGYSGCEDTMFQVWFRDWSDPPYPYWEDPFGEDCEESGACVNFEAPADFSDEIHAMDDNNVNEALSNMWIKFTVPDDLGVITDAEMLLTRIDSWSGSTAQVGLYKCLQSAATVSGMTWMTYDGATAWGTMGAAASGVDRAAAPYWTREDGFPETDLTITYDSAGVAEWDTRQNDGTNYGDLIVAAHDDDSTTYDFGARYRSADYETSEDRPILTLTYASTGGAARCSACGACPDLSQARRTWFGTVAPGGEG